MVCWLQVRNQRPRERGRSICVVAAFQCAGFYLRDVSRKLCEMPVGKDRAIPRSAPYNEGNHQQRYKYSGHHLLTETEVGIARTITGILIVRTEERISGIG